MKMSSQTAHIFVFSLLFQTLNLVAGEGLEPPTSGL
jgi:hypothetical protein